MDDSTILDKIGGEVDLDFMETETKSEATVPGHGMSSEEQRIKIAEACGWHEVEVYKWSSGWERIPKQYHRDKTGQIHNLPDYLNDLNAMHEAEKVLTISQREDYVTLLSENFTTYSPNTVWWTNTHATAAQRAEAFLKTLGLWKP